MNMRRVIEAVEGLKTVPVLYHGTCDANAQSLVQNGWAPRSGPSGGNGGQPRFLYLSTGREDALWFAQEKGCNAVVEVRDVPMGYLMVDPEDGAHDTLEDELAGHHGLPGKVVLTKPLPASHFRIRGALGEAIKLGGSKGSGLDAFLADYETGTTENGFNPRERIWNNAVVIELYPFDGMVHLSSIRVAQARTGAGTAAMKFLCDLADKHGVAIEGIADAFETRVKGTMTTKQLRDWYTKFGFKTIRGNAQEGYEMIRKPTAILKLGSKTRTIDV